ncbi:MAG: 30S ribosomal protein S4 [Deltaproteobacteria bacterium]|nr:30S ribosomal protein S4 [Deltaproteobacteria bacterium]
MARYIGPVCRLCRREGAQLFLKGDRCYSEKCSFNRNPVPPGQHGNARVKFTEYGMRLREKQKVRRMYGVLERQFRRYFSEADRSKGVTGESLLMLLERRLDNVVYRLGFASTRNEARQFVLHQHVLVNGKRVNVASYLVKPNDKISIREKSRTIARIKDSIESSARRGEITWLELDKESFTGTVKSLPVRSELTLDIKEQFIVEYYSR